MSSRRATLKDAPALCLLFGGIFALCSLAFGLGWRLDIAKPNELTTIEGVVERVEHTNRPKAGHKVHIFVRSSAGTHHITQDEFPVLGRTIDELKQGDNIVALVKHDSLWRDLDWLWELRRGNEELLAYKQMLEMQRRKGQRLRPLAYGAAAFALVLVTLGFFLRNRFGAWKSAI